MDVKLLRKFVRTLIESEELARVPQQLLSKDSNKKDDESKSDEDDLLYGNDTKGTIESSGAGAVAGFVAPVGQRQRR